MNKTIDEILNEENDSYQKTEIPENDFPIIEEGRYKALLIKAVIVELKATRNKDARIALRWEVKITDDKYHNRYLSSFTELQGEHKKWTKLTLKKCEIQLDSFIELKKILAENRLVNLPIEIYVKIDSYINKEGKNIKKNNFYINGLIKEEEEFDPLFFNKAIDNLPKEENIINNREISSPDDF